MAALASPGLDICQIPQQTAEMTMSHYSFVCLQRRPAEAHPVLLPREHLRHHPGRQDGLPQGHARRRQGSRSDERHRDCLGESNVVKFISLVGHI